MELTQHSAADSTFENQSLLCLQSLHEQAPSMHWPLFLYVSKRHPHLGLLFSDAVSIGFTPFEDQSVVGVRIEHHGEEIVLRHPVSHAYFCLADEGTPGPFLYKTESTRSAFRRISNTVVTAIPDSVQRISAIEATGRDPLAGPALATLLVGITPDYDPDLALFWCLIDFVERSTLLQILPLLAEQSAYGLVFHRLLRRLAAGDGVFPLDTRSQLHREVERFGWSIGAHSYGRPMIVDEQSANLIIGRYCSIAAFSTIVLGNHTTTTATTYPFALLHEYWPHAMAGIGLVDHVGRDVVIGHDVWIGISAVVLPGTVVGHGAIIAANAVARGAVPPYAIIAGNPGRVIRYRFNDATIARLLAIAWWDWPDEKVDRFIPLLLDPDIDRFLAAAEADRRLVIPELPNIALGRPARQSSLFPWSASVSVEEDAAGLVSGTLTGGYQCHTDMEDGPWWQVDLGAGALVSEVRVHNRLDPATAGRASSLSILASDNQALWTVLHERTGSEPFGGLDGRPLVWQAHGRSVITRFLRVVLHGFTCLHFDQIEIYGVPGIQEIAHPVFKDVGAPRRP